MIKNLSLTRQLIAIFTSLLFITALITSLPAFILIQNVLNMQIQLRMDTGEQQLQTLWQLTEYQVTQAVELTAERPTLHSLLESENASQITDYLNTFQNNTILDYLYVVSDSGEILAGSYPSEQDQADETRQFLRQKPVIDNLHVVGGIDLNTTFWQGLEQQTGFEYQSLDIVIDGSRYRSQAIRLNDQLSVRMLLSVEDVRQTELSALGSILIITILVTLAGSLLGAIYLRQRIHPLWRLRDQAEQMGRGDLSNPITVNTQTPDVKILARTLETSRQQIAGMVKELQQQQSWSNALMQSIVEGIITYNNEGTVVFHSESACQMLQWDAGVIGHSINDVIILADASQKFLEIIPPEGARKTFDVKLAGDQVITLSLSRARTLPDGETTIVLRDITESQRRRSAQAYYLANMSHEFRTPLSGMKASIEILVENLGLLSKKEQHHLLNSLLMSVVNLQNLIDNLLEGSKLEVNQFNLRRQEVLVDALLVEALRIMQPLLNRRQQQVSVHLPASLLKLHVDKTRLVQVFVNLLSNASKYSPENSVIDIGIDQDEKAVTFQIADTGTGIPEDQHELIFQRFVRLEHNTASDHSTGLGLSVVHGIILAHSGKVGVDPREDGGSIFWFSIPLMEAGTV